jgi:hypothetical protein
MAESMMKIAVSSNHPLAREWNEKYGWTLVDTSGPSLKHVTEDVILLDFLQQYFSWDQAEWIHSLELEQLSKRVDCLIKENSIWVSRSLMRAGAAALFTYFDIAYLPHKWVYVFGNIELCQPVIALLFDRGYQFFRILNFEINKARDEQKLEHLKRNFIAINLEFFPIDKLVLQKPEGTIFVFGHPDRNDDEELRQIISYFNFLSAGGAVINLGSVNNGWLKSEALATQLRYITERDIYKITEWQVRKKILNQQISYGDLNA